MNLSFLTLQFECVARPESVLQSPRALNVLRGALGAALRRANCSSLCGDPVACPLDRQCRYRHWFAPGWPDGSSVYREAPRPFVLRSIPQGSQSPGSVAFQLVVFATSWPVAELSAAMIDALQHLSGGQAPRISAFEQFSLPTEIATTAAYLPVSDTVRICFDTPVELKDRGVVADCPEFCLLIARLVDRVWALGRLYNDWPATYSLSSLAALSTRVQLIAYDWQRSDTHRRSARSQTIHSLGGFTGWADYRGPTGIFLPLLSIGAWTGVGRQTVWGKGVFHLELIGNITTPTHPLA